jgi:carboxymethylenebutenolidase
MTTSRVSFTAQSGAPAEGEIAFPEVDAPAPSVIVFHEWWGLNDHMRSLLDRLAADGFVALGIDLYDGTTTKNADEAAKLMGQVDWAKAIDKAKGALRYLAGHPRSNTKVGAIGFCMGGALTLAAACSIPELGAAVPFYGVPDPTKVDYSAVRAPILAHFASRDDWAKPEAAKAIQSQIASAGKTTMQLEVYEADHAFVNDTRPEVYDAAAAKLAWSRSVEFLKKHLS